MCVIRLSTCLPGTCQSMFLRTGFLNHPGRRARNRGRNRKSCGRAPTRHVLAAPKVTGARGAAKKLVRGEAEVAREAGGTSWEEDYKFTISKSHFLAASGSSPPTAALQAHWPSTCQDKTTCTHCNLFCLPGHKPPSCRWFRS